MSEPYRVIADHISTTSGRPFVAYQVQRTGGGCINDAVVLADGQRRYFVKLNRADWVDMFSAESEGLQAISDTDAIRVPQPLCWGTDNRLAYIVMEYVEFGRAKDGTLAALGRQLAAMHHCTAAEFGWHRDNTIGSTPQPNTASSDWVQFWCERRLGFQLELAARNGYGGRLQSIGEHLMTQIDHLFTDYQPQPSLLHGDFWGGNWSCDTSGVPVVYDPAVYYGDRETDIAMTELFGGFGTAFYEAYEEVWPLNAGYSRRKHLYNLYHILNHLNLFGGGYLAQAEGMIARLLR